jgi:glycosyltransferase involved in cell wall biosynthesis
MSSSPDNLLFSIIIPTYNRGERIKRTLLSALNQNFEKYEIIVVDDGSTDNTEEIIKSFHDSRIFYYKKENGERAAARNFGADKAIGNYITFLDSDDVLYPSYLLNASVVIKKNNCPGVIHLAYEVKDETDKIISKMNFIQSDTYKFLMFGNPLSCIGMFIKRDIFNRFRFNEDRDLTLSEDWELWLRLVANFGVKTDKRISAAMISHSGRSVHESDESKLLLRKKLSLQYAFEDAMVRNKYLKYYLKMEAYFDTYISLHLALEKKKTRALFYLKNAFVKYPLILLSRRFYAIIKYLIL